MSVYKSIMDFPTSSIAYDETSNDSRWRLCLFIGLPVALWLCTVAYERLVRPLSAWQANLKHGCQNPPTFPYKDWTGRSLLKERQQASQAGHQMAHYDKYFSKLGHTWEEHLPGQRLINTINVTNIKHILTFDTEKFGRGGAYHQNALLGPGILSSDGPRWRFSRDMVKPIFTKAEISDTGILKKHVDRLIDRIPRDGSTVDLQPLVKKMFMDSSSEFIFGQSTDSLLPDSPFADGKFLEDFNYAMAGVLKRRKAGIFAFQYCLDRKFGETIQTVHNFVDRHVERALAKVAHPEEKVNPEQYILVDELAKKMKDPIALRHEVLNVFAPSRDTVAILVGNCMFRLARRPDVWKELRTAAISLGESPSLNFDVLKSLQPFRNVIWETLRTTGPSGRIVRTAREEAILPKGGGPDGEAPVFVQKGDQVALFFWGLHHNKDIWGEDSYEFVPDRWNQPPNAGWEFVPFSGGRRICPANQQAVIHTTYILVRLTLEFESLENRDPVLEYVELQKMLTESRNGVKVCLKPAHDRTKSAE